MARITIPSQGVVLDATKGECLADALIRWGWALRMLCARRGVCGKCRVRVTGGAAALTDPTEAERRRIAAKDLAAGVRLACQATIVGDVAVEIFPESLEADGNCTSCWKDLSTMAAGPVSLFPPDTGRPTLGIALDMGTTCLAGYLVDLLTGELMATASCLNPQGRFGADVISRLEAACEGPGREEDLRDLLSDGLQDVVGRLLEARGVDRTRVRRLAAVGNTVMQHFLLGWPVAGLARSPFRPHATGAFAGRIDALPRELPLPPDAEVFLPAGIGQFVGPDSVAAMLACGFAEAGPPALLLDLGTNCEVVLRAGDRLMCASAAAGPALEGGHVENGMEAAEGAIDHVWIDEDQGLACNVIGQAPARGICGSGLVDLVARLLERGAVDRMGVLSPTPDLPIPFSQDDLGEIQKAKGAVQAATALLCREAGLEPKDIETVHIAGSFGCRLDRASARAIGLVPPLDLGRIHSVGNAAGQGAVAYLRSLQAREAADRMARATRHVSLASLPDFQDAFIEGMMFPEVTSSRE